MTCIKTGAKVYFHNYGKVVPADLYKVGTSYVVRLNENALHYTCNPWTVEDADYIVNCNSVEGFFRDDIGVVVVPDYDIHTFREGEDRAGYIFLQP